MRSRCRGTHISDAAGMIAMTPMRKIHAGDIHPRCNEGIELRGRLGGRSDGGDDAGTSGCR
jgi:hypothetical protein